MASRPSFHKCSGCTYVQVELLRADQNVSFEMKSWTRNLEQETDSSREGKSSEEGNYQNLAVRIVTLRKHSIVWPLLFHCTFLVGDGKVQRKQNWLKTGRSAFHLDLDVFERSAWLVNA